MDNSQVAEVFRNITGLLEMRGDSGFTIRAYQQAARTIERLPSELEQMVRDGEDLQRIPGIGKAISSKIRELLKNGSLDYFDRLRAEFPEGIVELMHIPGLGPKTTLRVWKELGVTNVSELEKAITDGQLATMPRMGARTAENMLQHIQFARTRGQRTPIARAATLSGRVVAALRDRCPQIARLETAGSLRRYEETVGDINLVCAADDPAAVLDALVDLPGVAEVTSRTDEIASVMLEEGVKVELHVMSERNFGSRLQFLTGSRQHNALLRERAEQMGLSIDEHGITSVTTGEIEEFSDEESLYERLGLQYVPPELRVGVREVGAAAERSIPGLVQDQDILGDLHDHTDWSDGRDPLEVMIAAAKARGLQYVAITDHSVGRAIANGLSPERLSAQIDEIRAVERRIGGIKVFCGTEMDIRADGSMDFSDDVLKELDWVIGSIHSAMNQEASRMTERIIQAMRNPYVSVIGHLTTRLIGERQPIEADFEALFRAAADTGTALEINASPKRLDLKDAHVYRARELGVPLVISTDAHTTEALDQAGFGAAIARRGWCEARHILNTMPLPEFLSFLKLAKPKRAKAFLSHG